MKSKELQLQLIDNLDHVVAGVEELVTENDAITHTKIDTLKSNLNHLLQTLVEIEQVELDSPEHSVRKMKDSLEELKKRLVEETPEPEAKTETAPEPLAEPERLPEPEPEPEPEAKTETETETMTEMEMEMETETETEAEPEPEPIPEPDLSDFITAPDDEPTSYVTALTAMAQAQAGEQDMSQVAVLSTAMPDEKVVRQVEQRSDIFTKLKETGHLPISGEKNALKSLVDRLKANKTVNDMHQPVVRDFRSCIGINEKFLFINDLFKGNIKEYNDMLQALEEACDGVEMNRIVDPLRQKYAWKEQSLAYITLSDLIKKKFGCTPQPVKS